jgi:hypothetical protein
LRHIDRPYIPGREATIIWFEIMIRKLVKQFFELQGTEKLSSNPYYTKARRDFCFFLELIEKEIYLTKKVINSSTVSNRLDYSI